MWLRVASVRPLAVVLTCLVLVTAASPVPSSAQPTIGDVEGYRLIAQWPIPDPSADLSALVLMPTGIEIAPDGTVFISDEGGGGIHVVTPDGRFLAPLGASSRGPEHIAAPGKLAVGPSSAEADAPWRLYALDDSGNRVVVYADDGTLVAEWPGVEAAGIGVGSDGRVYLADMARSAISIRSPEGAELATLGARGLGPGEFSALVDIDVATVVREELALDVIVVSDLDGLRVQLFEIDADGPHLADSHDLTSRTFLECEARTVQVAGDGLVFVSDGESACILSDALPQQISLASGRGGGTICGGLRLPRIRAWRNQFVALGTYDPRPGLCNQKDQRSPLRPTTGVIRFADGELRQILDVHPALDARDYEATLFRPSAMTWRERDKLLINDGWLRLYDSAGTLEERVSSSIETEGVAQVDAPIGGGDDGDFFGTYAAEYSTVWYTLRTNGLGRYRVVELRPGVGDSEPVKVLEPIWTSRLGHEYIWGGSSAASDEIGIAFDRGPGSSEIVGLIQEYDGGLVTERVRRWLADDGTSWKSRDIVLGPAGSRSTFVDLAVDADDTVYILDAYRRSIRVFDRAGRRLPDIPVAHDTHIVAVSPVGVPYVLRESGFVERLARDGQVLGRLDGRPSTGSDPTTLVGLLADDDGRVYTLDQQAGLVSVFEPGAAPEDAIPTDANCTVAADKTAAPSRVDVGQAVSLTLTFSARCGIGEIPSDIVLVVPELPPRAVPDDPAEPLIAAFRQLVGRVDLDVHRIGIVSYGSTATRELELTSEERALDNGIAGIRRRNNASAPPLRLAIRLATQVFDDPSRRRVMFLYHPDYCHPDYHASPTHCRGYVAAEEDAAAARAAGIKIAMVVSEAERFRTFFRGEWWDSNVRDAVHLASSDADVVVNDLRLAYRRLVDYRVPEFPLTDVTVTDRLPANMLLVPGSPSPGGVVGGGSVTWTLGDLSGSGASLSLRVAPSDVGRWPTNEEAVATFIDGWGQPGRVVFPVPQVEVVAPSATPLPSTATATPTVRPSPTAEPTATPILVPIYLPFAVRSQCFPRARGVDAVLVVDVSSSMAGEKLTAAREAIGVFLDQLRLGDRGVDRAALVSFDAATRIVAPLTTDREALDTATAAIETGEGTRMDLGIHSALDLLGTRDGDRQAILILLSDGRQDDVEPVLAAGRRARTSAVLLVAIGLGGDVDEILLRALATDEAAYHFAPSADDLAAVYRRVGGAIGCR